MVGIPLMSCNRLPPPLLSDAGRADVVQSYDCIFDRS